MTSQQDNLHSFIYDFYGLTTLRTVRQLETECKRVASFKNHLIFNLRCKTWNVIPRDLQHKPPIYTSRGRRISERYGRALLLERIRICVSTIKRSGSRITHLEHTLSTILNTDVFEDVVFTTKVIAERTFQKCKFRQVDKFERLYGYFLRPQDKYGHPFVKNLSSTNLSTTEISVLNLGPKFSVSPRTLPTIDIITGVESGLRSVKQSDADIIRAKVSNLLLNSQNTRANLPKDNLRTISSLRRKDDVLFLPADKGGGIVCLDKKDYQQKVETSLADSSVYLEIKKDPSTRIYNKAVELVKYLKKTNRVEQKTCNWIYPRTKLLPRFYGLPKTHKPGVPLRPIVSYVGTTTYELATFVSRIISPLVGQNDHHLCDTNHFHTFLSTVQLEPDDALVSFDVTALFTSIPVNKAVEIVKSRLDADTSLHERTSLTPDEICRVLYFLLDNTYFMQNGRFFKQVFGVPMGSPISGAVANIFMEDFERRAISTFQQTISFWRRYIDDVCAALKSSFVPDLLQHLNTIEPSLFFTCELECDRKLPFLDLCLTREDDGLITTTVYRKPTFLGQYLHYNSNHPQCMKVGIVKSLFRRAKTYSTSAEDFEAERKRIENDLLQNGYPLGLIRSVAEGNHTARSTSSEEWKGFAVIPYVKGVSEAIGRLLRSAGIRTAYRSSQTIKSTIVKPKDRILTLQQNNVVYKIPCATCPEVYIGETKRQLAERVKEHKGAFRNLHPSDSAVAEHAIENLHNINWQETSVVDSCYGGFGRRIKEAIHACLEAPTMNRDDLRKIPPAWSPNIQALKE